MQELNREEIIYGLCKTTEGKLQLFSLFSTDMSNAFIHIRTKGEKHDFIHLHKKVSQSGMSILKIDVTISGKTLNAAIEKLKQV